MRRATLLQSLWVGALLCWLLLLALLCQGLAVGSQHTCGPVLSGSIGLSVAEGVGQSVRVGGASARGSRQSQVSVEEVHEWTVARSVQSLWSGLQDDITFIRPAAALDPSWNDLKCSLAEAGHRLRGHKCGVWGTWVWAI